MFFSVIICTRNRCAELNLTLASIAQAEFPEGVHWELIVVDNGSSDGTSTVVDAFGSFLPVRLVAQPEPGLSNARNKGVSSALGEYIIWTDDDVLVDRKWLCAYTQAFLRWPEAAVFGGKITPRLTPPTPDWFIHSIQHLHLLLATRDFGEKPIPLSIPDGRIPFGANFAVRTLEQRSYQYDINAGVAPGRRRGGEETNFIFELLHSGKSGWWVPAAQVRHVIPASRQSKEYMVEFYKGLGEGWAYSTTLWKKRGYPLKAPVKIWIKSAISSLLFHVCYTLRHRAWVRFLASSSFNIGALRFFCSLSNH